MHDPSKVAVCPKWLAGSCVAADCTLQHELQPDLMPLCTFFLKVLPPVCGVHPRNSMLMGSSACMLGHGRGCGASLLGWFLSAGLLYQGGLPLPTQGRLRGGRARVQGFCERVLPAGRGLPAPPPDCAHGQRAALLALPHCQAPLGCPGAQWHLSTLILHLSSARAELCLQIVSQSAAAGAPRRADACGRTAVCQTALLSIRT